MTTKQRLADSALILAVIAVVLGVIYLKLASSYWEWANPKANWTTFGTEMPAPLRFERMEKYQ